MKTCSICGEEKSYENFSIRNDSGKYRMDCRACNAIASSRRYHEISKDPLLAKERAKRRKEYNLYHYYSITKEDYERMYNEQEGSCKICRDPVGDGLYVDHCHKTGTVRGLLCLTCNSGIGYLKEDITVLENAIDYLRAASV